MRDEQIIKYMTMFKKYDYNTNNCWDFVKFIYKDIYDYELPEYPVDIVPSEFKKVLISNFKNIKIELKDAEEGDIICFSAFDRQHAGIMIDKNSFIHLGYNGVSVVDIKNIGKIYAIYRIIK